MLSLCSLHFVSAPLYLDHFISMLYFFFLADVPTLESSIRKINSFNIPLGSLPKGRPDDPMWAELKAAPYELSFAEIGFLKNACAGTFPPTFALHCCRNLCH
jgi:hypothetical protein